MRKKASVVFVVLMLSLSACNLGRGRPADSGTTSDPPAAAATGAAPPTTKVTATEAPATEAVPTVVEHITKPGEFPADPSAVVGDQDSSVTADEKRAPSGDRFSFTRFERPFNAQTMDEYYPYLDIQEGAVFADDSWVYVSITLKSDESGQALSGRYGVEFDTNVDGDGDWLVLGENPSSTDWTTDGVGAWFDANDDVGGDVPTTTDERPVPENGYETQMFGPGVGEDPDFAWMRVSPGDPNTIQLAVKKEILDGSPKFLAGFWAGTDDLDPALFELSDNFTHEQAGAALTELNFFYPIKEISALDNTCRAAVGFQPTGREPGLCPLPAAPAQSDAPGDSGCPAEFLVCRQPVSSVGAPPVCICTQP